VQEREAGRRSDGRTEEKSLDAETLSRQSTLDWARLLGDEPEFCADQPGEARNQHDQERRWHVDMHPGQENCLKGKRNRETTQH